MYIILLLNNNYIVLGSYVSANRAGFISSVFLFNNTTPEQPSERHLMFAVTTYFAGKKSSRNWQ